MVAKWQGKGLSPFGRCPTGTQNSFMKFFVYIIRSRKNNDIYIGSTENLENRLRLHNAGKVKSTKSYKPWELLEYREFDSRNKAVEQERFLKTGQQKEILKNKYKNLAS